MNFLVVCLILPEKIFCNLYFVCGLYFGFTLSVYCTWFILCLNDVLYFFLLIFFVPGSVIVLCLNFVYTCYFYFILCLYYVRCLYYVLCLFYVLCLDFVCTEFMVYLIIVCTYVSLFEFYLYFSCTIFVPSFSTSWVSCLKCLLLVLWVLWFYLVCAFVVLNKAKFSNYNYKTKYLCLCPIYNSPTAWNLDWFLSINSRVHLCLT